MRKRRYEILLPLKHNDGRPVSDQILNQTRHELVSQFDGVTFFPQAIIGSWQHAGTRFEDELVRIQVEVDETPENLQFFIDFKARLVERFEQIEIYIAHYPVDIL